MKLDQERQVGPSDVYDDTLPSGVTLETSSDNIRDDLNGLRSQVRRLVDFAAGVSGNRWYDEPGASGGGVVEMTDNSVEVIVVGNPTESKVIEIDYSYQLPISGRQRNGSIRVQHDNSTAEMVEEYDYMVPEITGVTFSASMTASEIRLVVTNSSVGENPKMFYRSQAYPVLS